MAIRIITDSASDISQAEAEELGIVVIPLTTTFGNTEYRDGVDLSHAEFYEKLIESDELPRTSQITPHAYAEAFRTFDPTDDILVMVLSSKLSGTYESALLAAQEFSNVTVFDTLNVTVGERIQVQFALQLIKQGLDINQVVENLTIKRDKVRLVALLDTLEYLKKGGRISAATAMAGTLLSIKPVIAIEDGVIEVIGKARGSKNGNNLLIQNVQKSGGIDFTMPFSLAYSGLSDKLLRKYVKDSEALYAGKADELPVNTVGSTIGTHVGPGCIAVCYYAN